MEIKLPHRSKPTITLMSRRSWYSIYRRCINASNPNQKLRTGIEMVVEAFEKKAASSQQELVHWKQVASGQRQQIVSLENEITQLQRKIADMERGMQELKEEKRALAASKNSLLDKFNVLRRNAMQLDTFRKQIVSMVEFSPNALQLPDADASFADVTAAAALYNAASAIGNEIQLGGLSFNTDEFSKSVNQNNEGLGASNANINRKLAFPAVVSAQGKRGPDISGNLETLHLTQFNHEDHDSIKGLSDVVFPNTSMTRDDRSFRSRDDEVGNLSIDASTLYRQIRSVLSHADFDKFATTIAEFNAGIQSAEATISSLSKLIKDPRLVNQMKGLIMRAIAETSQDFSATTNRAAASSTFAAKSSEALAS